MSEFELRLTPKDTTESHESREPPGPQDHPVTGYFAVGCGLLSIFASGMVFVPLGLVFSLAAFFLRQTGWGIAGIFLSVIGFLTTPVFLMFVGLTVVKLYLDSIYQDFIGILI